MPVRPCYKCGVDCDWCVKSNHARLVFPKATVPPAHDVDTNDPAKHHCVRCFVAMATAAAQEG